MTWPQQSRPRHEPRRSAGSLVMPALKDMSAALSAAMQLPAAARMNEAAALASKKLQQMAGSWFVGPIVWYS